MKMRRVVTAFDFTISLTAHIKIKLLLYLFSYFSKGSYLAEGGSILSRNWQNHSNVLPDML